jgi:hypothetical protein
MAEEYENYRDMEALARKAMEGWDDSSDEGVVLAADLRALEDRLRAAMDELLLRYEELHTRVWRFEERLGRIEERLDGPE